jgi:transcriptional regulator with XRE-family HTH domain
MVAYNLARARQLRGWTQEEAARELAKHQEGAEWSKVSWSSAERSVDGKRIRQFTADDLLAFSLAFGLPITWWLLPPGSDEPEVRVVGRLDMGGATMPVALSSTDILEILFAPSVEMEQRLERAGLGSHARHLAGQDTSTENLFALEMSLRQAADLIAGARNVVQASEEPVKRGARRPGKGKP